MSLLFQKIKRAFVLFFLYSSISSGHYLLFSTFVKGNETEAVGKREKRTGKTRRERRKENL